MGKRVSGRRVRGKAILRQPGAVVHRALVAVYRYFGKHVKVGAGYNFTDFSEDLTDLRFRHEGRLLI